MSDHNLQKTDVKIAFLGFGEAAQAFVKGWNLSSSHSITAYDIKTDSKSDAISSAKWSDYQQCGVTGCATSKEAVSSADLVFSTVTADQAFIAAKQAATHIPANALFFDCNSCAPGTKEKSATHIDEQAGRYVDVAVMAPVHPKLHRAPLLVSGPNAMAGIDVLQQLDMDATKIEGDIGAASTIKMVRSVMMKGMEALFLECVLAGRKAGVDETVLKTLDATYPGFDFKKRAAYMMERSMVHGVRRAAEMREVVITLEDLGFSADVTKATVDWQQKIGDLNLDATAEGYGQRADAILQKLFVEEDVA